jgi:membrane peptidoglycan carboxypeptidase
VIEQITQGGRTVYQANEERKMLPVDPAAVFQLRTMLQGVVARGTAARLSPLSSSIGGKTGTTDDFNDTWFAGFSRDVTVVVWVGYDNAKGKHTLGQGQSGSRVALPIFEHVIQAVWTDYAPRAPLPGPSREIARHLVAVPIERSSGQRVDGRGPGVFIEYFRLGSDGRYTDTQNLLLSRGSEYSTGVPADENAAGLFGPMWFFGSRFDNEGSPSLGPPPTQGTLIQPQGPRGNYRPPDEDLRYLPPMRLPSSPAAPAAGRTRPQRQAPTQQQRARQANPGYLFGGRPGY